MIIEMKFDTECQPDHERVMKVFKALGLEKVLCTVKTCSSIMETARRRTAGEQVVFKPEPKKRGRKPKNIDKE